LFALFFISNHCLYNILAPPQVNPPRIGNQAAPIYGEQPLPDDIKVEYHPHSKKATETFHFENYKANQPAKYATPIDPEPWKPFCSLLDFEFAEFMLEAHLNDSQCATLLSLVKCTNEDPKAFTFSNTKDLKECWKHARATKAYGVSI